VKQLKVQITARDNGERLNANLLLCPRCDGRMFFCYFPEGIEHLHFQCIDCSTSFCDGCSSHVEPQRRKL
jgi:hypothetical protein